MGSCETDTGSGVVQRDGRLARWLRLRVEVPRRGRRWALLVLCGIAVAAVAAVGWREGPGWLERHRGLRLTRQGDFARAEPLLVHAFERDGEDFAVARALVAGYLAEGKPERAVSYADRCCALHPGDTEPFKLRMNVHRALTNATVAIADAQVVLALDPGNDAFRLDVVAWLRQGGNFDKAERLCRQALELQPGDPEWLLLLALVLHDQGKDAGARRALQQVLRARPPPQAQLLAGKLFAQANRFAEAVPLFREVVKAQPDNRLALYYLAAALARTGRHDEARRCRDEFRKLQGGKPWFEDVTVAAGIDFQHFDCTTDMLYIQETFGSGVAWIDYDNDGWPDLFLVQDGPVRPRRGDPAPTSKLYRNNGDGTFTDVTERVGLARAGFGMGVAVGDYDNDGYDDLAVTYVGGVVLYHNEPDGKGGRHFVDVTARSGISDPHWATSCAWGDLDGDGFLDLYVCNYVEVDLDNYRPCIHTSRKRYACGPDFFPHTTHRLFHNNGDGTFRDVSVESGIASVKAAPGLAVALVDLDDDGLVDIYVANDLKPAYLFHNQGGGKFVEKALTSGCAVQPDGRPPAGMGVAVLDLDGSGRPSLVVTNFEGKPHLVFRNRGGLAFDNWSEQSGINHGRGHRLAFGVAALDADLDGLLDLVIANGHVSQNTGDVFGVPFRQEAQILRGTGSGRFEDVSAEAGEYFQQRHVARGVAWADYDNDGRPDLAISHNGDRPALLRNGTATDHAWLRLELVGDGKHSNRNAIGARVEVHAGEKQQVRWVVGGGSYLSASDRRLLLGLGSAEKADKVVVRWPSGGTQEFHDLAARAWYRLHEGQDRPELVRPGGAQAGRVH